MSIHFVKVNQMAQACWAHKLSFWNLCRLSFAAVGRVKRTEEDFPHTSGKRWLTLVTSIWLPLTGLRHIHIPTLKKQKSETLTTPNPTYIVGKVLNRVTELLSASSHPLPRLASALPYCSHPLAFSSLPPTPSTHSSLAVESLENSLLCYR